MDPSFKYAYTIGVAAAESVRSLSKATMTFSSIELSMGNDN